jgi:DNA-binding protein H-NS
MIRELDMTELQLLSVQELDALIARASAQRAETRERRRLALKDEIEGKLKAEGFTAYEVLGAKVKPKPQALPVRYADPAAPEQTWSGKGRTPGWLQAKIDGGSSRDEFRVRE